MSMTHQVEILLVEDSMSDAELTIRALTKRHLANHLVHVKDGAEALDFLFGAGAYAGRDVNDHPKVILLDLKLPKLSGLEVLRAIRSDERTKTIPVVVMTSSAEQQDVINSYGLGTNSFIVKPVDFDNFSKVVADLGHYWVLLNRPPESV
jgi:CheY-like chemotaxis protein